MKLNRDTLIDILYEEESDEFEQVWNKMCDSDRWSATHDFVFKHKETGQHYYTCYSVGATEMQYEEPWEYEDEVECTPVWKKKMQGGFDVTAYADENNKVLAVKF